VKVWAIERADVNGDSASNGTVEVIEGQFMQVIDWQG